jgi:hypothetical protein
VSTNLLFAILHESKTKSIVNGSSVCFIAEGISSRFLTSLFLIIVDNMNKILDFILHAINISHTLCVRKYFYCQQSICFPILFILSAFAADSFTVGLTNNPPATMAPITYGYTLCGQWPGAALLGATMFVRCANNLPPARYVVIIEHSTTALSVCELEVFRAIGKL